MPVRRGTVRRGTVQANRDQRQRVGLAVEKENIGNAVLIAGSGNQIGCHALEYDIFVVGDRRRRVMHAVECQRAATGVALLTLAVR